MNWNENCINKEFKGILDDTLRDGMQHPYPRHLSLIEQKKHLDFLDKIKIVSDAIIGMSGIGEKNLLNLQELIYYISEQKLNYRLWILSRCIEKDLKEVVLLNTLTNLKIGASLFICFNKERMEVEGWTIDSQITKLKYAIKLCKNNGIRYKVNLEDATRTDKDTLAKVLDFLINEQVERITICDTAGNSTLKGTENIMSYTYRYISNKSKNKINLDWHGHNDRGIAVANSIMAIHSNTNYIHCTLLGIGERNGNTSLDTLLLSMYDLLKEKVNWEELNKYTEEFYRNYSYNLTRSYPFFGDNSFTTSTGTHVAYMYKAMKKQRYDTLHTAYSPKTYRSLTTYPKVYLSNISGKKSIQFLLENMKINTNENNINKISNIIKNSQDYYDINHIKNILEE